VRLAFAHAAAHARTRSTAGFAVAALAVSLAVVAINVGVGPLPDPATVRDVVSGSGIIAVMALAFGAAAAAGGIQHGSAALIAIVNGGRRRVALSEMLALAGIGATLGLVCTALCEALAVSMLDARGDAPVPGGGDLLRIAIGGAVSSGVATWLGAAGGLLAGRTGPAVAAVCVFALAAEPALATALPALDHRSLTVVLASLSGVLPPGGLDELRAVAWAGVWMTAATVPALMVHQGRDL
jgi:hypothetical protein